MKVIEWFLERYPTKKVAFLVPTRPLVEQQTDYLMEHCLVEGNRTPVVQKLVGYNQAEWSQSDWNDCIANNHVLLGTAALFQQSLVASKVISVESFSLFVFDECHNAVGNSPMAAVMRDAVAPYIQRVGHNHGPRVLGLTASFINGSLKNMEKKRRNLEALMLSTIFCPEVPAKFKDDNFVYVKWKRDADIETEKHIIQKHVEDAVAHVKGIKEVEKIVRRCVHVFGELGAEALFFYIDEVIVKQIREKINGLKASEEDATIRFAERMIHQLPSLKSELETLSKKLRESSTMWNVVKTSSKLEKLIELIKDHFQKNVDQHGIVFCEQAALVPTLAKQLNDALEPFQILCGSVAGTGFQSQADRETQLEKFKNGECRLLVATAALEEGIDVASCAFVVRYTMVSTTKAHIQGAGRARHPNAKIFYFENNPTIERIKEASMKATAKNTTLALSQNELRKAAVSVSKKEVDLKHPYPFTSLGYTATNGGEVNVYNCKQIFNHYCSIVLGSTIQAKKVLYKYSNKQGDQKVLAEVRFPTPDGWNYKTENDYKDFWAGVDMEDVLDAERVNRKTVSEKEEMCFVYVVVVELRQRGLLGNNNQPNMSVHFETRRMCPVDEWSPPMIQIKNLIFQSNK